MSRPVMLPSGGDLVADLGGDDDVVAAAGDDLADELLVGVGAVEVRGVQQGDAEFESPVGGAQGLLSVDRTVGERHAHASEPLLGDDEPPGCRAFVAASSVPSGFIVDKILALTVSGNQ